MSEEGKLFGYQKRFEDGFVRNKLMRKPVYKAGFIYRNVEEDSILIKGDIFIPTWDDTDHFHFVCAKCKSVAHVLAIDLRSPRTLGFPGFSLRFMLGCPDCGATGQRKIYLEIRDDSAKFQKAFDEGKIYFYADKRKPAAIIDWKEVMAEQKAPVKWLYDEEMENRDQADRGEKADESG
ncbi:MAG: hypothetical protein QW692_02015 [Nitrososphaerota archaeon]